MRTARTLTGALFFAILSILSCSYAKAGTKPVGTFSFDLLQTGPSGSVFGFNVFNSTQPGTGSQIATFVNFVSLTLTVTPTGGGTMTVPLIPTDPFGDFSTGALFSFGQILSATLTGAFAPTTVTLADGIIVHIGATLFALLDGGGGGVFHTRHLLLYCSTQLTVNQGFPTLRNWRTKCESSFQLWSVPCSSAACPR
jgi:hypothetical protein